MKKLKVGIVGMGFMGRMHYRCWQGLAGVEVTAICDKEPGIAKGGGEGQFNIEGAAKEVDLSKIRFYQDFKQMAAKEKLDAVSITAPTYLHREYTEMALGAGWHVLCEKPMALQVKDCQKMIEAAKVKGRILLIGHCLRFWPEYVKAKEIAEKGAYGALRGLFMRRLGSAPVWGAQGWFEDEKRSGGMALDLHIHDTDYALHLLGRPTEVRSYGYGQGRGGTRHILTHYLYDDDKLITAEGGWDMGGTFGFEMSFNMVLEKATIVYDNTRTPTLRVCPAKGQAYTPEMAGEDAYLQEITYFSRRIRGEHVPSITSAEESAEAVRIIEAEKRSVRTGKTVKI